MGGLLNLYISNDYSKKEKKWTISAKAVYCLMKCKACEGILKSPWNVLYWL